MRSALHGGDGVGHGHGSSASVGDLLDHGVGDLAGRLGAVHGDAVVVDDHEAPSAAHAMATPGRFLAPRR